jgi:hypothetical protein
VLERTSRFTGILAWMILVAAFPAAGSSPDSAPRVSRHLAPFLNGTDPVEASPAPSILRRTERSKTPVNLEDYTLAPSDLPALGSTPVDQVIVAGDGLASAFQELAEWETRRGIPTVVRSVSWIEKHYDGFDTPARIRTFLRAAHDLWGTQYVILGGDVEHVPPRYVNWGREVLLTDLYYECLDREWNEDGDDRFAEPAAQEGYDNVVNDLAEGPDGSLWIATYSGLVRKTNGGFLVHDLDLGFPSNSVYSVSIGEDGSIWAGTEAGAVTWSDGEWSTTTTDHGLPSNRVFCILAIRANDVWAGTDEGIAHWNGSQWRTWGNGPSAEPITSIAFDGTSLWAGTLQGAVRIQNEVVTHYDTSNSGLRSNWVLSVASDPSGAIWFGHIEDQLGRGGYSKLAGGGWTSNDLAAQGGFSIRDFSFGPGSGEWWAATGDGIFHHTAGSDELLGDESGLAGNTSTSILRLDDGDWAVGGNDGLSLGQPGNWLVFDSDNGLPASESISDLIDLLPDLTSGRIPASNPGEVAAYIEKLRQYERGSNATGGNRVLFMGEVLSTSLDGKTVCQNTAEVFPSGMQSTELYESNGNQNAAAARQELNEGPGIVVNVSHGSYDVIGAGAGFELLFNSDLDAIDSGGRSGFYVVYSCNIGGFDQDCSMEHLLFNQKGGAVATISNTREAIATLDAEFNRDVFEKFFQSSHARPADALAQSRREFVLADEDRFQSAGWWRRMYFARSYLGAPTVAIWRGTPKPLSVQHPASCPLQRAPFEVVLRETGGAPVPNALVCIAKGSEDYARGWTDSNGKVVFQFRPESTGQVRIVATAPDHIPYEGTAQVSGATQPALVAHGWASANEPGAIAPEAPSPRARTMGITLGLRNAGLAAQSAWQVQLACNNPGIQIAPANGTLPPIGAGQIGWTSPFSLQLSPDVLDGTIATLVLTGTGPSSFTETFRLAVETPVLAFDGIVTAGAEIIPRIANRGSTPVKNVTATLYPFDGSGAIVDGEIEIASIHPKSSITPAHGFQVSGPLGAKFVLVILAPDCTPVVHTIDRQRPEAASSLRATPLPDGAQLEWTPSPASDLAGYRVLTRGSSGLWTDARGQLVTEGATVRLSIPPGSSRQCRVVAVDQSGLESAAPAEATVFAGPPTLAGWPQRLQSILGPSPLVAADLDGDGKLEVIVGSMWEANAVHVFRVNGQEWTDGDLNPGTNGVFGKTQGRIHGAPLVVDVDGDGSKEIFAGSYDGFVHAWKTNGAAGAPQALAGWPVAHGENGVRSSPVAGDLDGDGDLEIVTVANDGLIRAMHANGTMLAGWPRTTPGRSLGCTPAVADLNHDGRDDVVVGGTDSTLYVYSGNGMSLPGWPHRVKTRILACPVLVDIDGDEDLEIFVFDRSGTFYGFQHDDNDAIPGPDPVPGWPVQLGALEIAPPSPAVADFDGDGVPEIVVNGLSSIVILRANGTNYGASPITTGSSAMNSPVIADLDSDGELDILAGLWDRTLVAVHTDGSMLAAWPWMFLEPPASTPTVADMDGDGKLDVVIGADDASIRILRLPTPALPGSAPWPGFHGGPDLRGVYDPSLRPAIEAPAVVVSSQRLFLAPAQPNPFRTSTEIRFEIAQPGPASLEIFDVAGRQITQLISEGKLDPGIHTRTWDGRDSMGRRSSAGVYFVRLKSGGNVQGSRILLLR